MSDAKITGPGDDVSEAEDATNENDRRVNLDEDGQLDEWLAKFIEIDGGKAAPAKEREPGIWAEIRLFISSTFIDTQAERDIIVKVRETRA